MQANQPLHITNKKGVIAIVNPITTTFHKGTTVAQKHNRRDPKCVAKEKHIDPNGEYIVWIDEDVRKAYKRIFDEAVKEYNARQSDSRRIIDNYYQKVKNSKQQNTCYEIIVTLGDKDSHPPADTCKEIYKEVVDSWSKRNPNLILIGAYYHNDEQGAPHLHIDYIPVAYENLRGMSIQCSHTKALKEMGFQNKNGKYGETELTQWTDRERVYLDDLCRQRGIEVHHPDAGKGKKHLEKEAYILTQKLAKLEAQKTAAQKQITALSNEHCLLLKQKAKDETEIAEIEKKISETKDTSKYISYAVDFYDAFIKSSMEHEFDPAFKKVEILIEEKIAEEKAFSETHNHQTTYYNTPNDGYDSKKDPLSIDYEP